MRKTFLLAACVSLSLLFAMDLSASNIIFDLAQNGTGDLGHSSLSFSDTTSTYSLVLTAVGVTSPYTSSSNHLYYKTSGGDETGIGMASEGSKEIPNNNFAFLQVDVSHLTGLSTLTFSFGSVQSNQGWQIWGGNTAGVESTLLFSGTGDDTQSVALGTYNYFFINADPRFGSGGDHNVNNDILLTAITGVQATPEPSSMFLLGSGLLGLVGTIRKKMVR